MGAQGSEGSWRCPRHTRSHRGWALRGGRGALEGQRPPCSEPTVFSESGAGPRGRPVSRLHGRPRRVRRGKEGTGAEGPLLGGLSEDSATPQGSGPWGGEREAGQSPQLLLHHAHAHTAASPSGSDPQRTGQFSQSIVFPQTCPMCLAPPPPPESSGHCPRPLLLSPPPPPTQWCRQERGLAVPGSASEAPPSRPSAQLGSRHDLCEAPRAPPHLCGAALHL